MSVLHFHFYHEGVQLIAQSGQSCGVSEVAMKCEL